MLDANGQALVSVYARGTREQADIAKVRTLDEARRVAVNVARVPELLFRGVRLMHKTIPIAVGLGFIVLSDHALAASREVEDICFYEASQRSFNGRGEREQFIANCIADLTAAPPKERRRYKKRRY